MMKSKKGFLRILEAFFAVMIIGGVMGFIYINNIQQPRQDDLAYQLVRLSLKEISNDNTINNNLRDAVLTCPVSDPPEKGFGRGVTLPPEAMTIAGSIGNIIPPEFDFRFRICVVTEACGVTELPSKNVISDEVSISSPVDLEDSRKIRIFVWEK